MKNTPTGYSGTPLAKKLGIKPGFRVFVDGAPEGYRRWLEPVPGDVVFKDTPAHDLDLIHVFSDNARQLRGKLVGYVKKIKPTGMIWVSWPKKSSGVATDITEDVIRDIALPMGLVDIKVCAINEVWSGLKLVIRVELRKPARKG